MGHPTRLASLVTLLAALFGGVGCASLWWSFEKALRKPGQQLETFPDKVSEEYDCARKRLPFFKIEVNELVPPRIKPGSELNHRLIYVMCPARRTGVITGKLATQIRFRGRAILSDTIPRFEIKPGRWVIDSFIRLPEFAETGIYALDMRFSHQTLKFAKSLTFLAEGPRNY